MLLQCNHVTAPNCIIAFNVSEAYRRLTKSFYLFIYLLNLTIHMCAGYVHLATRQQYLDLHATLTYWT